MLLFFLCRCFEDPNQEQGKDGITNINDSSPASYMLFSITEQRVPTNGALSVVKSYIFPEKIHIMHGSVIHESLVFGKSKLIPDSKPLLKLPHIKLAAHIQSMKEIATYHY